MAKKLTPFDAAEFLESPEVIEAFLNDAFETGNQGYIAKAFSVVVKAKGKKNVLKDNYRLFNVDKRLF